MATAPHVCNRPRHAQKWCTSMSSHPCCFVSAHSSAALHDVGSEFPTLPNPLCTYNKLMPSLDSGDPGGTEHTLPQNTVPDELNSDKSATNMSVQPAQTRCRKAAMPAYTEACGNVAARYFCSWH
eukprot:GHRR01031583.1.p2 GENE.GHRR01031583.1~~GHRR01031583.1.p2  ORF type:complete len:125 (+),score=25.63 GHRR01031583.1:641-1015(+)